MIFREANLDDLAFVAQHSISHGLKEHPASIDFIYALEHDGVVLGVGGVKLLNPTTAWCWLNLTVHAREHIRTVYRVTKEWLDELIKDKGLIRVMAAVEPYFEEAVRTVEHLGFERESTMPHFFGNDPAILYVKFAEK